MCHMIFVLVISLALFQVCQAFFLLDYLMGFGSSKMEVIHALNGIKARPEFQCRLALAIKDKSYLSILLNALTPLEKLVSENEEFIHDLSGGEKLEMLEIYILNAYPGRWEPIGGKALDAIMTILCREKAFNYMKVALNKKIIREREVLIYFLKHRQEFLEAIKAGILEHLDITTAVLVGKGVLHILIESGEEVLCEEIFKNLMVSFNEKIKFDHFTKIEGNSILHSAAISNNPKIIRRVVRDFNNLCGHVNEFGMSPLKLALVNGNSLESIKVFLEHGCVADGETIFKEEINFKFKKFEKNLQLHKFSKFILGTFPDLIKDARRLSNNNPSNSGYYFMGLLNSSRELNSILDFSLIGSPLLFARRNILKLPSLWTIVSNENFNEKDFEFGTKISIYGIVNGIYFKCCSDEIKGRVLKNLTKIQSLDFSGVALTRFLQILIQFSEPSVFAHFVYNQFEFYFCIRAIFKHFKDDYEKLIPFLDAIGFQADEPFADGIYPVDLAVKTGNLMLLKFLINIYKVDLRIKTAYEGNNILHYCLNGMEMADGMEMVDVVEMVDYLLRTVPDLLQLENNFGVTPLQVSLTKTENNDNVSKILGICQTNYRQYDFNNSKEVQEIYEEIIENWPVYPGTDNHAKTKFQMMFETCGSDEVARLLLSFASKKLLKHYVDEKENNKNSQSA